MARCFFLLIIALFFACHKKKAASTCTDNNGLYNSSAFPIGVAVNPDSLFWSTAYGAIVTTQFNSITPENIFKASFLHPSEHFFYWSDADRLANYAVSQNKRLHGHTLVWHNQLPAWIINFAGSDGDWEQLFKDHIQTIVKHFAGKAQAWDVVNEAFNDDGTLRQTIWQQHLGNNYIEKAFHYAHEADPDALLFYNDYSLESNPTKRSSVISYLNNLRLHGATIDGIGMQCHITIAYPDASQIADAFKDVADNNYLLHVSELDLSIDPFEKGVTPTSPLYATQADIAGALILNYKQIPEKYQYGITLWGVSDNTPWQSKHYPLLYDTSYHFKPVYCKLKETL